MTLSLSRNIVCLPPFGGSRALTLPVICVCCLAGLPVAVSVVQLSYAAWWLLWAAAVLALWSLSIYFANVWTHFVAPQSVKKSH